MSAAPARLPYAPGTGRGHDRGLFPLPDYDSPTSLVLNWGSNLLRSNEEGIIASRLVRSLKGGPT